ncbi:CRISPR-associated protein Csn2-St [Streptococcus ruminantium]|uniref:CRISPR-associated protein Csn2-St n=1 Tax=Streptococcus ruminantium TaxID=1917441 RepID=UPI0012DFA9AF|nr:CRISPR-associated protein Csn2-St [Streptococcus ruminantium]
MNLFFTHHTLGRIPIHFGQFTQIVGQNQKLKYYIWQLLIWYLDGKKYREEDLTLFQQAEPEIFLDETVLKRNAFQIISISDVRDIVEQMSYKKGTIGFSYLSSKIQCIEIMEELEAINHHLQKTAQKVSANIDLVIDDTCYEVGNMDVTPEQIVTKQLVPYFKKKLDSIAFEFVPNENKLWFLLQMMDYLLEKQTKSILLVFKNMDDYLGYSSFTRIAQHLEVLCRKYPYFHVMIFPSQEGYLYLNESTIETVNILADQIEHYPALEFLYERYKVSYPSNNPLDKQEFLTSLRKVSSYLFCSEISEVVSLSYRDLLTLKIINTLYQYDTKPKFEKYSLSVLEENYLNT